MLSSELEVAVSDAPDEAVVNGGGFGDSDARMLPKPEGTGMFESELSPTKSLRAVACAVGDSLVQ